MAWFQNLAGKAEDLLNKIDQNAATVLQDSTTKLLDISTNIIEPLEQEENNDYIFVQQINDNRKNTSKKPTTEHNDTIDHITEDEFPVAKTNHNGYNASSVTDSVDCNNSGKATPIKIFEKVKSESCGVSTKSDSISYNNSIADELQTKLEERLLKLETENQEINQQILNIRHLYSEIKNENSSLKAQLERANESVLQAQNEMEQYKARAQRILQEKENLMSFKREDFIESNEKLSVLSNYNEEMNKELTFQQERNKEMTEKNNNLNMQLSDLQQELVSVHNAHYKEKQNMQNNLAIERKHRLLAEEECRNKIKEINTMKSDISQLQTLCDARSKQFEELKIQIKERNNYQTNADLDSRIQSLTETLMTKQSALETITSERNALRIQFEKLERDYNKILQSQRNNVTYSHLDDVEEGRSQIPKLTVVSPLDVGVKRRVKHTFSTLDAISIRTGVFLRRYPIARIFVFCYMILLHVWVLIILFTYIPTR